MAFKIINETTASNDSYNRAQEIPDVLNHGDSIQINGNFSGSGDSDWYDILFNGLDSIASLALMPQGNFPVKLTIKDSSGTTRGIVEGNPGEMVRYKYPLDVRRDSILVGVEIKSGTVSGDYVLYCTSIEADDVDPLKNNDYPEDAQKINIGDHIICTVDEEGDYDYFEIVFPKDGLVDFTVYPGHRDIKSRLNVSDVNDKVIEYTYVSEGYPAVLQVDVKANNTYYISLRDRSPNGEALDLLSVLNVDYAGQGGGDIPAYGVMDWINDLEVVEKTIFNLPSSNATHYKTNVTTIAYLTNKLGYKGGMWELAAPQVSEEVYNALEYHPGCMEAISRMKLYRETMTDRLGNPLDMSHFMATLCGYYCPSTLAHIAHVVGVDASYFGWAGDLATATGNLYVEVQESGEPDNVTTARKYAKIPNTISFGMADLFSDIDAAVFSKFLTDASNNSLAERLRLYFTSHYIKRFDDFMEIMGGYEEMKKSVKIIMTNEYIFNNAIGRYGLLYLAYKEAGTIEITANSKEYYFIAMCEAFCEAINYYRIGEIK